MKLEDLKERLRLIEEQMLQTRANYNALEGAKQELLYWVGKVESDNITHHSE